MQIYGSLVVENHLVWWLLTLTTRSVTFPKIYGEGFNSRVYFRYEFIDTLPPSYFTWKTVQEDTKSTSSQKSCAYKDFVFEYANQWTDRHLSSCKSYRVNNHFGRRMKKWDDNYSRVFGCKANPTPAPLLGAAPSAAPSSTLPSSTAPPSTAPTSTAPPSTAPPCGCYAENEEITISANNCILDLGTAPDVGGTWSFTFEFKINSLPDEKWWDDRFSIMSGIGF